MADDKKQNTMLIGAGAAGIIVIILIIWSLLGGPKDNETPTDPNGSAGPEVVVGDGNEAPVIPPIMPVPRTSMDEVIRSATTWDAILQPFYGQPAPDFTLNDLNGTPHKLSSYLGKNVILVFWASWCPPCKVEIPNLKQIRNEMSEDSLTMLAISDEAEAVVKAFATQQALNYTVLLDPNPSSLPAPFNSVENIPTSFFIDPQGKIKLATQGPLEAKDIRAILEAQ